MDIIIQFLCVWGGVDVYNGTFLINGENNEIWIGKNTRCKNFLLRADGKRNRILIGKDVSFGGGCIHAMDGTRIKIGDGCMLSHDIDIRSGDGHSIYEDKSNVKYNKGKNISIGKHVWIGIRAQILKGVVIKDNCIVGASSVINKPFGEENCIIAGYPAKIVKRNIRWER